MSKAWQASLKELDAQFSEVARQTRVDDKPMLHLHLLHMLATGVSKSCVWSGECEWKRGSSSSTCSSCAQFFLIVVTSPEVEAFLTQKLVVRRLKQLDTSVQESYTRLNDVGAQERRQDVCCANQLNIYHRSHLF